MHPNDAASTSRPEAPCASRREPTPIFPPRGADAETYRAWLAQTPWPEVVFGAQVPAPARARV